MFIKISVTFLARIFTLVVIFGKLLNVPKVIKPWVRQGNGTGGGGAGISVGV